MLPAAYLLALWSRLNAFLSVLSELFGVRVTCFVFLCIAPTSMPWLFAALITMSHSFLLCDYSKCTHGSFEQTTDVQDGLWGMLSIQNKKNTLWFIHTKLCTIKSVCSYVLTMSYELPVEEANTMRLRYDTFIHRWLALCLPLPRVPSPHCQYLCSIFQQ